MTRGMARIVRRLVAVGSVATLVLAVTAQQACVLAQSSGDVPRLPETRPTILHQSVVPSTSAILTRFPEFFIVPVEMSDPKVDLASAAFVDYNPLTGDGLVDGPRATQSDLASLTTRVRTLTVTVPEPTELGRCHVIEVVVALRFRSTLDPKNAHTPDEPGGDSVTWIYNPSGDVNGCPTLDAGLEASTDGGTL